MNKRPVNTYRACLENILPVPDVSSPSITQLRHALINALEVAEANKTRLGDVAELIKPVNGLIARLDKMG